MKKYAALLFSILIFGATSQAATGSGLFVKDQANALISVADLVQDQVDVQVDYGYENFCYRGDPSQVMTKMKAFVKTGYFFSGGGGGFEFKGLKIRRGIAVHSLVMTLEDEVVPGEFRTVVINPCSVN